MSSKRWSAMMLLFTMVLIVAAACAHSTGQSIKTTADDATITAKVKTKLAAEQMGTLTHVDVDTQNGVVYLNGTVSSQTLKTRATEIARDVSGVTEVVNNLQVSAAAR